MSVFLRRGQLYLGVDPGYPQTVYADRHLKGVWEAVEITPHESGLVGVRFLAADRTLTILPDGRLETRPAGTWGLWEQLTLVTRDDGTLSVERAGIVLPVEGYTVPPTVPHLEQRDRDFVNVRGERIVLTGIDAFCAFRQYRDTPASLDPFFAESAEFGFDCWRVFMQGSKQQNQVLQLSPKEPGYYDSVRPFADLLNQHGIVLLATVYVDNQDERSDLGHWSRLADRLRGSASLLSGFNQWSKNDSDFDPWALPDPGGLIWSRGSDTDDIQTPPRGAPASELHSTRVSWDRSLMDAIASPINMRATNQSTMVWMTEGMPWDEGDDPKTAWRLGRAYSVDWALAVFHNRQSQRGLLMKPGTRACAEAWAEGMRL